MTPEDLRHLADEAIKNSFDDRPGFVVAIPGLRMGATCRLAKGLTGQNLGHYNSKGVEVTHVLLDANKVLKFLEGINDEHK